MDLSKLFAYQVEPRRTVTAAGSPAGGFVAITEEMRTALATADRRWERERRIAIDLKVDPTTRTCETRDLLIQLGFGIPLEALTAATALAARLSTAMDLRSAPCLCILAVEEEEGERRVTIWTFPRDNAFQFRAGTGRATVRVLTDVFSQASNLRKAALFEGKNLRSEFINGRVLDFQAGHARTEVADFWIVGFLDASLGISSESGSRMLANCLRKTWETTTAPNERDQLFAAATAIRQSPQRRWAISQVADQYFSGELKARFVRSVPNDDALNSSFDFDRETFDRSAHFRVFRLDSDVYVSAPFDEIGRSVQLTGDQERRLSCEGTVVDEKVRTRG